MNKAEKIHYKAVIAADNQEPPKDYCISAHADHFNGFVEGFIEGYHQAEKDLELTWKDMKLIYEISCDTFNEQDGCFYNVSKIWEEILKRFNKKRKEK